jgi:hypothetical protein
MDDQQVQQLNNLYVATGGSSWKHQENWLSKAPLSQWSGVEVDSLGQINKIRLKSNNLTGLLNDAVSSYKACSLQQIQELFLLPF